MSNTGTPDPRHSLITQQTPWGVHVANYKYYGIVTINSDPMHLLKQGTEAYVALEQVCIAQDTEIKRLAAANEVLMNVLVEMQRKQPSPTPAVDVIKLPKYQNACHKEVHGNSCWAKNCSWLHEAQAQHFPREVIDALPIRR